MNLTNVGDRAQALLLQRQNADLKLRMTQLTGEMASGRKADVAAAVGGDFRVLAGIEHSLTTLSAYHTATTEAAGLTDALQKALETMQTTSADLAPSVLSAGTTGGATHIATAAFDARQKLFSAVSALNVRVGDRYALSGAATDKQPILGAQQMLDDLKLAATGQVTASGVISAVDNWFAAPAGGGGYLDLIYGGSANPLAPFQIGAGEEASLSLTANDPTLRDMLKGLALAGLVAEGILPGDQTGQALLMQTAGQRLIAGNSDLAVVRANLGSVEGQIDAVATRNQAEGSALEIARNAIVGADPFETANELEVTRTQLETLYAITARLSHLNLADFLR